MDDTVIAGRSTTIAGRTAPGDSILNELREGLRVSPIPSPQIKPGTGTPLVFNAGENAFADRGIKPAPDSNVAQVSERTSPPPTSQAGLSTIEANPGLGSSSYGGTQ